MPSEPFPLNAISTDDQWRSFQTYLATYLAGMLHQRDVFTISRAAGTAPPLVEFRHHGDGVLRFSMGDLAWSDEPGDFVEVRLQDANQVARQTVALLRGLDGIDSPAALRVSASGPASSVSVLARGGFISGGAHPARVAALAARATADIDVDGDPIEAAAREVGSRAFAATKNGSIAAIAAANALAKLRASADPFGGMPVDGS